MNLTRVNWPLGWTPYSDENGDSGGLLRMDNLHQENNGALSLVRGIQKTHASAFSDYVDTIYSQQIGNVEGIWVSLNQQTKSVQRSKDGGISFVEVLSNGGDKAAYGSAFGKVLICAGSERKKDSGTIVQNLGIQESTAPPQITSISQPELNLWGGWTSIEGHDFVAFGDAAQTNVDAITLRGVILSEFATDTTNIEAPENHDIDEDTFTCVVKLYDNALFKKFRVQINLDIENYYWFEWDVEDGPFQRGIDAESTLNVKRKDFQRQGSSTDLDWRNVASIQFSAEAIADVAFTAGGQKFVGGAFGQLTGVFDYLQVNVNSAQGYIGKSKVSPSSLKVTIINGRVNITAAAVSDAQVNEVWIYRRKSDEGGDGRYLRVATTTPGGSISDTLSEIDAILLNLSANLYTESVANIPEAILGIEGLYNERILYLTNSYIYLSERLNPDSVDTRYTIRLSGDAAEKNLWIKTISNNTLMVGTSRDLYEISGTLLDLPDGTIDAFIRRIGEAYPPLAHSFGFSNGQIFYVGADGIRVTTGSNSINFSPQLRDLFAGQTRHGIPPIAVLPGGGTQYPITIGRNKIYFVCPHQDGTRRLFIFDLINKTVRLQNTDPISLWATESDRVFAGYGGGSGNFLRELESGTNIDGTTGQNIFFLTVFDHNQQPRNRKDTFTLKLVGTTGNQVCTVSITKDGGAFVVLGSFQQASHGTSYFKLDGITLGFRYAIKIESANILETFELQELTIEYDPRPEQLNYLRIPNSNLGTISRKRVIAYAFVIDTLGNNIEFTPFLDNSAKISTMVNKDGKLTYIHFFTDEQIATDVGGILSGGVFEYYQLNLEETVSEKLPTPTKFLIIPANDYGSPNRKRHTSYKFQIHTRGVNVRFTPKIDGVNYPSLTFSTVEKRTVEYFFPIDSDIVGIDIGGTLETLADTPFEFYGVIIPQELEVLPPRLESYYIPFNNFGAAAKKRIRTIPIIIDTYGFPVEFTPIVDGVVQSATTLVSNRKQTLYHYFTTDVFGTDFGGTLKSPSGDPFEFYGFGQPENVEILPVPKKYDQLPILRFDRIGKLFTIRTKLIAGLGTTSIPIKLLGDEQVSHPNYTGPYLWEGIIPVIPGVDDIYHINLPKSINTSVVRVILGPTEEPFHRYDLWIKVALSGMETDNQWQRIS